ncbi:MAG: gamma carbonic anhydrase family protein [Desulfitobacteriaceae bacterium]|nr:gamma carbonic anhydrase family protein [Desulfitobacteriaceae bacterium]MDI6879235.1 gamma carbonic anhydrase family protein [Desulfitobacteriaceae bacterium]MDI6913715.1 gamma carbonic anhydrase family protein [Desulfitobacteriaceae bacterium]
MLIEFNGKKPKVSENAFIAPNATLIGDVTVGEGSSIWFGAQLRADFGKIVVGKGSSIQDNAVVHVLPGGQTTIEDHVTVAHGAVIHNAILRKGCLIGMNAAILDNAVVGEQAMVAAGSVVTDGTEISARHLVTGSPAKPKKEISGNSRWWVEQSAEIYIQLAQAYLKAGIGTVRG